MNKKFSIENEAVHDLLIHAINNMIVQLSGKSGPFPMTMNWWPEDFAMNHSLSLLHCSSHVMCFVLARYDHLYENSGI